METIKSKITTQGQISVPAKIREKLGVGPGSVIEWEEMGEEFIVRRSKTYSLEDLHTQLFPDGPPAKRTLKELKSSIGEHLRKKHARR